MPDAESMAQLWERVNPGVGGHRKKNDKLKSGMADRIWKALSRESDLDEWEEAFEVCRDRSCLNGDPTSTGFIATLFWALGPINSGKLFCGFYAADKKMATSLRGFQYEVPPGAKPRLNAPDPATQARMLPLVRRVTGGA